MKYFNNFLCNKNYYSQRCATASCVSNQAAFTSLFITASLPPQLSLLRLFKFIFALAFVVFLAACTDDDDDPAEIPPPPGFQPITVLGSDSVNISWGKVGDADYYEVYRGGALIDTINNISITYYVDDGGDEGLAPNRNYNYDVRVCDIEDICSYIYRDITALTLPSRPVVPRIRRSDTDSAFNLVWDVPAGGADYYEVWNGGRLIVGTLASLSHSLGNLLVNTEYSYAIKACNNSGCSAISASTPPGTRSKLQAIIEDPPTPRGEVINSTSIRISWDIVIGATYYKIYDATGLIKRTEDNPSVTSYVVTGLTSETEYRHRIKVCNEIGCSLSFSQEVVGSTSPDPKPVPVTPSVPATPGKPVVTAISPNSINISWDTVVGASTYKVTKVIPLPTNTFDNVNAPKTYRQMISLSPDTTYGYTVRACNVASVCSAPSTPVYGTTHPTAPTSRPSDLTVSALNSTSLRISWESVAKATHYEIFNATKEPPQPQTLIANISAPLTNHIVDGLIEGTRYTYFVRACNMAGCSEYAENSAMTVINDFAAPKIQAVRVNPPFALNISWQPQDNTDYYQVVSDRFPIIRVEAPTNYTVVTGLEPDTIYYYTIRWCITNGECRGSYQGSGITSSLSHVTVKLAWVDQLELPAFNGYMGILDDDTSVIPPMLVDPVNDPTQQSVDINSLASRLSLVGVRFDTTDPVSESNLNATNFLETKFSLADANLFNSDWDEDHRFARRLSEVAGGVFFANTNSSAIETAVVRPANRIALQSAGVERYLRLAALGDDAYNAGARNTILGYTSTLPLRARYNSTVQRANTDEINAIDDLIAVNISGVTEDVTVVARMCALPGFSRDSDNITCAEPALPVAMELSNILLLDGYWKTPVDEDTNCLGGAFDSATHFCDIQGRTQPALNPATSMPFSSVTEVTAVEENRVIPLYIRQYINRRAYFAAQSIDDYPGITKLAADDSLNEDGYYLITIQALNSDDTRVSNQLKMIFEVKVE